MKKNSTPAEVRIELRSRGRNERRAGGAGILSSLLSKLGLGGAGAGSGAAMGGGSGIGGAGGLGGLLGGGVLAGKTGVVALVLAGTTVAAGLGIFSNQMGFLSMPSYSPEESLKAFQQPAKPGETRQAAPARIQKADGSLSPSLRYMQQANGGQLAELGAGRAPADRSMPDNSAAAASATRGPAPGRMVPHAGFQNSATSGGGSTAHLAPSGMATGIGGDFAPIYHAAAQSAGSSAARAGLSAVSSRGASSKGAMSQARAAQGVLRSNLASGLVSSQGSGTVYDGGGGRAGLIGPGGAVAGGGVGSGGAGLSSQNSAVNPSPNPKDLPSLPNNPTNATPWRDDVKTATTALLIAFGLLAAAAALKWAGWGGPTHAIIQAMRIAAMAAAAVALAMGIKLLAQWHQTIQGLMFVVPAAWIMYSAFSEFAASVKAGWDDWFSEMGKSLGMEGPTPLPIDPQSAAPITDALAGRSTNPTSSYTDYVKSQTQPQADAASSSSQTKWTGPDSSKASNIG